MLDDLWHIWADVCAHIDSGGMSAPSGIGEWSVRELVGHVASRGPVLVAAMIDETSTEEPRIDSAAGYFRTVSAAPGAAQAVAERATEYARGATDADLVAAFVDVDGALRARMESAGDSVVESPAGFIQLADFLQTRIVEAAVHLIDLLRAANRPVSAVPDAALRRALAILLSMAPAIDLVELATGRRTENPFPLLT